MLTTCCLLSVTINNKLIKKSERDYKNILSVKYSIKYRFKLIKLEKTMNLLIQTADIGCKGAYL